MIKYEILDPLPRWAYTGSEWTKMIEKADKMVDGYMYVKSEPVIKSDEEKFLQKIEL